MPYRLGIEQKFVLFTFESNLNETFILRFVYNLKVRSIQILQHGLPVTYNKYM